MSNNQSLRDIASQRLKEHHEEGKPTLDSLMARIASRKPNSNKQDQAPSNQGDTQGTAGSNSPTEGQGLTKLQLRLAHIRARVATESDSPKDSLPTTSMSVEGSGRSILATPIIDPPSPLFVADENELRRARAAVLWADGGDELTTSREHDGLDSEASSNADDAEGCGTDSDSDIIIITGDEDPKTLRTLNARRLERERADARLDDTTFTRLQRTQRDLMPKAARLSRSEAYSALSLLGSTLNAYHDARESYDDPDMRAIVQSIATHLQSETARFREAYRFIAKGKNNADFWMQAHGMVGSREGLGSFPSCGRETEGVSFRPGWVSSLARSWLIDVGGIWEGEEGKEDSEEE